MKKIIIAVALCTVAGSSSAAFTDGNELMQWSIAYDSLFNNKGSEKNTNLTTAISATKFLGYVVGVVDTLGGIAVCPPNEASREQMMAIVQKYMKQNPEKWTMNASVLVGHALMKAFPCPTK